MNNLGGIWMKRKLSIVTLLIFLFSTFAWVSAATQSMKTQPEVKNAIDKLVKLEVLSSSANKNADVVVSRREFARMIIKLANLEEQANLYKNSSVFPDVKGGKTYTGYINLAVKKGYMTGLADKKFHPEQAVTFAQVCTAIVKMLGYTDTDLSGTWPQNYIDKALELKLTSGLNLASNDKVLIWQVALVLQRLLDTYVKTTAQSEQAKKYYESTNLYKECIVLDNDKTLARLAKGEVLTDSGVLFNKTNATLEVGKKYMLRVESGKITRVYGTSQDVKVILTTRVNNDVVYYEENKKELSLTMPLNSTYYYNGEKQNSIVNVLKPNQRIYLGKSIDTNGYDYVVVKDVYGEEYGSYTEVIVINNAKTSRKLGETQIETDKGIYYSDVDVATFELGAKYGVYIKDDTIKAVYKKVNQVESGTITYVSGNTIRYKENGNEKTMILPQKPTYYYNATKQTSYDSVKSILKINQYIYFGRDATKSVYEYVLIKDVYDESFGDYIEAVILLDSTTSGKLQSGQIKTDKGIFSVDKDVILNGVEKISIGTKYGMYVKDGVVKAVVSQINKVDSAQVLSISSNTVKVKQDNMVKFITLPQKPTYYYNGDVQSFDNVKNVIKTGQTIYLGYDKTESAYEYILLKDKYDDSFGTYTEVVVLDDSLTSGSLQEGQVKTDKGIYYAPKKIGTLEIGAKYGVYIKDENITAIQGKLNNYEKGQVTSISGIDITVKEDNTTKKISLLQKPSYYYNGTKQSYDSIKSVIKAGQRIYIGYNKDNTECEYVVIKDPYDERYGTYTEIIVMGNSSTNKKLQSNQILTDKGIYSFNGDIGTFEPGAKYGVYIKDDGISSIAEKLNSVDSATVVYAVGTKALVDKGGSRVEVNLSPTISYYYNGEKLTYGNLSGKLQKNSALVFGIKGTGYEYCVIFDPIYSRPFLAAADTYYTYKAGALDLSGVQAPIIKNGDVVDISYVLKDDVVYVVTDIWQNNRYILLVVSDKVEGYIKGFSPSRFTPTAIKASVYNRTTNSYTDVTYELSDDFDMSILMSDSYKIGQNVYFIFGYDGKLVTLSK